MVTDPTDLGESFALKAGQAWSVLVVRGIGVEAKDLNVVREVGHLIRSGIVPKDSYAMPPSLYMVLSY